MDIDEEASGLAYVLGDNLISHGFDDEVNVKILMSIICSIASYADNIDWLHEVLEETHLEYMGMSDITECTMFEGNKTVN